MLLLTTMMSNTSRLSNRYLSLLVWLSLAICCCPVNRTESFGSEQDVTELDSAVLSSLSHRYCRTETPTVRQSESTLRFIVVPAFIPISRYLRHKFARADTERTQMADRDTKRHNGNAQVGNQETDGTDSDIDSLGCNYVTN